MRCRRCGEKAILNMRQHKRALCTEHYLEWLPTQTQRFIKKYALFQTGERFLLSVSGGKDARPLGDVPHRLEYQVDGLYTGRGIDGAIEYSAQSLRLSLG